MLASDWKGAEGYTVLTVDARLVKHLREGFAVLELQHSVMPQGTAPLAGPMYGQGIVARAKLPLRDLAERPEVRLQSNECSDKPVETAVQQTLVR